MTNKLRAAIIGLGVGKAHAKGYLSSPDAELVALCDANEERLLQSAADWKVEGKYTDFQTMLTEAKPDIVSVCLPNALHAPATIAALQAGAHVVCEKPMAVSVEESRQMVAAAEQANRHLMMSYNYRYRPDSQWMCRVAQSGRLGTIYHVNIHWRRETGIPGWGLFGSKAASGGGALIDLGVHVIDLGLWMMGFPAVQSISASTRTLFGPEGRKTWGRKPGQAIEGGFDVDDGGMAFLRTASGMTMFLQVTWAEHTTPQEDSFGVELHGTEGTAALHVRHYGKDDTLRLYTEIEGEAVTVIPSVRFDGTQGHEAMIHSLLGQIQRGETPSSTGIQGLTTVQVLEALYRSAAEGREVKL
jgi:predicted dehydrogenase